MVACLTHLKRCSGLIKHDLDQERNYLGQEENYLGEEEIYLG